jgi:hypothetical protein
MKKLFTTLALLINLITSANAQQVCTDLNTPSATMMAALNDHFLLEASQSGSDLDEALNPDGSLEFGESGSFNNLKGVSLEYNEDGAPRFVRRAAGWNAIGSGVSATVNAIAISGGDVYVGGLFTTAGGNPANRIAKWNGSSWSALGTGVDNDVYAIAISGSDVYVGGYFTAAGGNPANYIAKWNGSSWSALGTGVDDGTVWAIAVSGSDVYVGGAFTTVGGNTVNGIAKWNGSSWSALGAGFDNEVGAIAISGTDVYVGGAFTTAGGNPANYIAKWNGSSWSALGSGASNGVNNPVYAIAISGSNVYVGGDFTTAGGSAAWGIAKWNGTSWSALATTGNGATYTIAISGSDVYAAGQFTSLNGTALNRIGKWNGTSWSPLGSGVGGEIYAIKITTNKLYAGGGFTTAGSANPSTQQGAIQAENETSSMVPTVASNNIAFWEDAALPISLVSTSANVSGQNATLSWVTAQETNNDRFVIELQTPQGWKQVGEVQGKGTTTQESRYAFTVPKLDYGKHIFRLVQHDFDGTKTYSSLIEAYVELQEKFALSEAYPNPFNPSATFTLAVAVEQNVQIALYDITGRKVQTLHDGTLAAQTTHAFSIDGSALASGRYFVRVMGENFATNKVVVLAK